MKNSNFLKENNAKHFWYPMAHPAESLNNPPTIMALVLTEDDTDKILTALDARLSAVTSMSVVS